MLRYQMLGDRCLKLRLQFLDLDLQLLHIHNIDANGFILSFALSAHTIQKLDLGSIFLNSQFYISRMSLIECPRTFFLANQDS